MSNLEHISKVGIVIALCNAAHNICNIFEFGLRHKGPGVIFDFHIYESKKFLNRLFKLKLFLLYIEYVLYTDMNATNIAILALQLSVAVMAFLLILSIKMVSCE